MELQIKLGWLIGIGSIILVLFWIVLKELVGKVKQEELQKRNELGEYSQNLLSEKVDLEAKIKYYTNLTGSGRVYQFSLLKEILTNLPEPRALIANYFQGKFIAFRFYKANDWTYSSEVLGGDSVTKFQEFIAEIARFKVGGTFEYTLVIKKDNTPIMTIPITKTRGDLEVYVYNFPKYMVIGDNDYMIQEAMKVGFNAALSNE